MTVRYVGEDAHLLQLLRLELAGIAEVLATDDQPGRICLRLVDLRSRADAATPTDLLLGEGGDPSRSLPLPFPLGALAARLCAADEREPIAFDGTYVRLGDASVALTELEAAVFAPLFEARGTFVSREELRTRADLSDGALNVYIHYLRRKLTADRPVLEAVRGCGYRLTPSLFPARAD